MYGGVCLGARRRRAGTKQSSGHRTALNSVLLQLHIIARSKSAFLLGSKIKFSSHLKTELQSCRFYFRLTSLFVLVGQRSSCIYRCRGQEKDHSSSINMPPGSLASLPTNKSPVISQAITWSCLSGRLAWPPKEGRVTRLWGQDNPVGGREMFGLIINIAICFLWLEPVKREGSKWKINYNAL